MIRLLFLSCCLVLSLLMTAACGGSGGSGNDGLPTPDLEQMWDYPPTEFISVSEAQRMTDFEIVTPAKLPGSLGVRGVAAADEWQSTLDPTYVMILYDATSNGELSVVVQQVASSDIETGFLDFSVTEIQNESFWNMPTAEVEHNKKPERKTLRIEGTDVRRDTLWFPQGQKLNSYLWQQGDVYVYVMNGRTDLISDKDVERMIASMISQR